MAEDTSFLNGWDYADKHVDSSIEKDQFISSTKCIVYAAPAKSAEGGAGDGSKFHRIGVIQGYSWGEQRQIEMIFELGSEIPYLVPGRTTGSISLSRVLLFGKDILNVIYYEGKIPSEDKAIRSLKDISKPVDLMFAVFDNKDQKTNFSRVFSNCYIQSRNESISAGQIIVAENVSILYENVISVTIPQSENA